LHGFHSSLNIIIVALDLLLVHLLPFTKCLEDVQHTSSLLLSLDPFTVLASNIAGDGIEDALIAVITCNKAQLLQLEKVEDCMSLDLPERHTGGEDQCSITKY
jgi:hypothetical protein